MKLLIAQIYPEPRGLQAGEKLVPHRVMEVRVHTAWRTLALRSDGHGFKLRLPRTDRESREGHGVTWSSIGCPTARRLCTWKRSSELSNAACEAPSTW